MTLQRILLTTAAAFIATAASHAATITFDSASDFNSNFWTSETHSVVWAQSSGNGRIQKSDNTSSGHFFIYNTTSTGGTAGSGGTSASSTLNTFQDFDIQADFRTSTTATAANSLGFWVKGSADGTGGYFVIFRLSDTSGGTGSADMRVFGPNSGFGGTGTEIDESNFDATSNFLASTDYTFRLQVRDVSGGVSFTGSIWNVATGTQIGSDINYTDSASGAITGAGQVGFRLGTGGGGSVSVMDNFTITPIPEPSAAALGLIATAAAALRRRRR